MGRRATVDWDEIRKDYEGKGFNIAALAIKYDIAASTILQKIKAEAWRSYLQDEVDPEFSEDEEDEELIKADVAINEQKRYLMRLHREIDASTSKPGQMKQWIKEGTEGNIDSRRKAMYQMLSLGNRIIALKNAAHTLKMIIENEIACGTLVVPKGKKALLEKAAREMGEEDDMFAVRKMPDAAD